MSKARDELRQRILKEALVKLEVLRWEKHTGDPIKQTNQQIVEIPIDDLMSQVDTYVKGIIGEDAEAIGGIPVSGAQARMNRHRAEQRQKAGLDE